MGGGPSRRRLTTSTLGLDYFSTPIMVYFSAPIDINRRSKRLDRVPHKRIAALLVAVKVADRQRQPLRCKRLGEASSFDDIAVIEHGVDRMRGVLRAKERVAPVVSRV